MTILAAADRPGCWPRATNHADWLGISGGSRDLEAPLFVAPPARAIPGRRLANFLEFPLAGFHYSVISPREAPGRAADKTFNLIRSASSPAKAVPLRMHKEMIDGPSTRACQSRFGTGDRKINANGF